MGSEKGAVDCDVGLGLNMKKTTPHHLPYYHHSLLSSSSGGFGAIDGGGSFYSTGNKQLVCMGDGYEVPLQNFNNTDATTTFKSSSSSCSTGTVRGVVPFTSVQYQELERQTIVFNYMRNSIPVPSELLFSINKSSLNHAAGAPKPNRLWDMGGTNNGKDPEPWRCRRTDGKKWRCSRDVAPDQKYCERHAHKNKPRSRKPVEVQQSHSSVSSKNIPNLQHNKPQFLNQTDQSHVSAYPALVSSNPYENQSRYSDWFMKGGATTSVSSSTQQWHQQQQQQQQLMQSTIGMKRNSSDCYKNPYVYDHRIQHDQESVNVNDQCGLFLGPKLSSLEGSLNLDHTMSPINDFSHHKSGKFPLSSLTLSMSGDNQVNDEEDEIENGGGNLKNMFNWMNPGSWMGSGGSTPGGPLAEALCLGMGSTTKMGSNPESPHGGNTSSTTTSYGGRSPPRDGSHGFNLM